MGPEERLIEMKHLPEKAEVSEISNIETLELRALKDMVESYEKQVIQEALKKSGGDKSKAAEILDVSVRTLYYKMERYGID